MLPCTYRLLIYICFDRIHYLQPRYDKVSVNARSGYGELAAELALAAGEHEE